MRSQDSVPEALRSVYGDNLNAMPKVDVEPTLEIQQALIDDGWTATRRVLGRAATVQQALSDLGVTDRRQKSVDELWDSGEWVIGPLVVTDSEGSALTGYAVYELQKAHEPDSTPEI